MNQSVLVSSKNLILPTPKVKFINNTNVPQLSSLRLQHYNQAPHSTSNSNNTLKQNIKIFKALNKPEEPKDKM